MRNLIVAVLFAGGLPVLMPQSAAAVNCDQVRRYLSTGRTVEDISDTMVVSVDEVKKCQQAAKDNPAPAATPGKKADKPQE